MDQIDTLFHTQAWVDALLDEKTQQMSFPSSDFFTNNEIEAIGFPSPEVPCTQGSFNTIMVSDSNHIQVGMQLSMLQNLFNSTAAIAIGTMHVRVCLTMHPRLIGLVCGHLAMFLQH